MHSSEPQGENGKSVSSVERPAPSAHDFVPGLYAACTAGLIAGVVTLLSWLSGSPPPWRQAAPPLIVALRETFEAAALEAGLQVDRDRCRSLAKYLSDGKFLMHYTCQVPEASRPALRAALVDRGFVPESDLNGRMFGLRKGNQIASLYCPFGDTLCDLKFEHVPPR